MQLVAPTINGAGRSSWLRKALVHSSAALVVTGVLVSCGPSSQGKRYSRKEAQASLKKLERPGLVIGDFTLDANAILDGDTVKVKGLDSTLRLLAIDTEETYKNKKDRRDSDAGFVAYREAKQAKRDRPVKLATPLGEDAKTFAKTFFSGVDTVRLERDHPKEIRGRFDRYLAYVFVRRDGKWLNYNVEAVRAGMSPYFTKYGYSRRFHEEFLAAEKEAQTAGRGIWKPGCDCYDDYPIRKKWWDARADFILDFERKAAEREDYIILTNWDAMRDLSNKVGEEVTVLATVGEASYGDRGPSRAVLSRKQFNDLPAIFFDRDVFSTSGILGHKGEFVAVTGVVGTFKQRLQIIVNLPSQVVLSEVPRFGNDSETASAQNANTSEPQSTSK